MKTKRIAITAPEIFTNDEQSGKRLMSPEEYIVYIARVSNPSNQLNTATGAKLLRYLIKNKHWSPFEHVSITYEIQTSRAIAAQILRHRSFTFQEFSQRYAEVTNLETLEWRMQGKTNRQVGSEPAPVSGPLWRKIDEVQNKCTELYKELLEYGIAKECARMVLPLNTQTTIYMTGSLRSWIHYLELRCDEHTQKEHRDVANNIKKDLEEQFPEVFKAINTQDT